MSLYLSAVIADSPRHYWRCADPGGHLLHDIGSARDVLAASVIGDITGWSGPISDGGSADFTLDSTFALSGVNNVEVTSPFTMEALVWSNTAPSTIGVIAQWTAGGSIAIVRNAANNWQFFYNGVGIVGAAVAHQSWKHLVGTFDGATVRFYVDAILQGSAPAAPNVTGGGVYALGANFGGTQHGESFLSEVAMYGSALSAARVSAHFLAIDNVLSSPVFGNAGGLTGASGTDVSYLGMLQQILQSVRKVFPTT